MRRTSKCNVYLLSILAGASVEAEPDLKQLALEGRYIFRGLALFDQPAVSFLSINTTTSASLDAPVQFVMIIGGYVV